MSDFGDTWRLTRGRFDDAVRGLSPEQLNWRIHPNSLTLGEMALHVAGVEINYVGQLLGTQWQGDDDRLRRASYEGVVDDAPFPYPASEINAELIESALSRARELVESLIDQIDDDVRARQVKTVLGPTVDGTGVFTRIAHHPGYHQGQAHLIKSAPGFPT